MAAACSELTPIGGNPPPRPNIPFILADNLGWRDVGYHGSEIQTPNLDRMAHAGVRMEQHGRDLWPWLAGHTTPSSRTLHWRGRDDWGTSRDRLALRHGDWKLVARERGGEIVGQELYDLAQDPSEERDLAGVHREQVRELEDLLKAQLRLDAASRNSSAPEIPGDAV